VKLFADDTSLTGGGNANTAVTVENEGHEQEGEEEKEAAMFGSTLFYVSISVVSGTVMVIILVSVVCCLLLCHRSARRDLVRHHSRFTTSY